MRRCRETEHNEYISLCYHNPCHMGFCSSVSTILAIQDISASPYHWLQVCSALSQPILVDFYILLNLKMVIGYFPGHWSVSHAS